MELPIRVMIVLFVAIVVGGMIIVFSNQILDQTRNDLYTLGVENVGEDRIIEVATLGDKEILALAEQCVRDYSGTFDEQICFAVFTQSPIGVAPADGTQVGSGFTTQSTGVVGAKAIKITFAPTDAKIYVTG